VHTQKIVDLRDIKPTFDCMPDYYAIYYSVYLKNYKILNAQVKSLSDSENKGQ